VTAVDDLPDEAPSPKDSLREWRVQILNWILYGLAAFGVFALIGGERLRLGDGRLGYAAFYLLIYATVLLAAVSHRLGFLPRALLLLGALYACAVGGFALGGHVTAGPVFLFAAVAMATLLFDLRWGVGALLLCVATMGGMGVAFTVGWLEAPPPMFATTPVRWFTQTAIFLALGTATIISMAFLLRRLERSVETSADLVLSLKERVRERERAQEALRASEARLLEAQRVARIGSFEWDFREQILWWSDEMYRVLGRETGASEPRLESFLEQVHSEDRERVAAAVPAWLSAERPSALEYRIVLPDGSIRHLRSQPRLERGADGEPDRLLGTVQDVTEARELERQLRQSQKLEAVGQLAGGVAHDFNNLLTVITGYGEILLADFEGEPQEAVKEICLAAERATALTRQLLAFGRQQFVQPRVLDVNAVVREFEGMLRRLIGEDVTCELLLDPSSGRVMADAGQLQQILLNLLLNARDAMPRGGNLTVQTCEVEAFPEHAVAAPDSDPIRYVCLSVRDDGCGMDAETHARIFEPFFTTKNAGKGTGLGLSTVYGIVKQGNGEIRVRSSLGHGTTVEILLPQVDDPVDPAASGSSGPENEYRGSETILVVEDEEPVRRMTREALERCGYRILEARDGVEGLAMARRHREDVDLVLTDVVMPRMGGVALVDQLREECPKIRALFMSGYARRVGGNAAALLAGAALLEKPFGPRELSKRVRETLDA
jgi:two-component system cell cycle sensor histidine kinase/response regulator CckA